MAKIKPHDQNIEIINGKSVSRVVETVVKDGKIAPDDTDSGVKR